ncbi:MAG: cyclic-phosphate processing receiver domain-containing protein [Candidatus Thorarchaeota archaeon]|jgi:hypothetical protein
MNFKIWLENQGIKIWLDDERDPTKDFIKNNFGSHGDETWVKTAKEAIDLLSQDNVVSISLDHDLGPPEAGSGHDVAKWIEEAAFNGEIKPLQWRVHSANPVGARNISQALSSAERFWKS